MKNIPLYAVVNLPEMEAAAIEVLRSGRIASGEYVARFEAGIGHIVGQPHVVSTLDMTSAIVLALHLSGVGPGDEVLTTAFACMATNSAIALCGATPVWVDLLPGTVEMDPDDLLAKIGPRSKAALLYHVAGYPGPAQQIAALCRPRGIALIEDCDNALFAYRDQVHVGAHGDFAVYSFYPNRQINTTEGGALVCRDPAAALRARRLRRFGIDPLTFRNQLGEVNPDSDVPEIGWACTMNNLCAALGCAQLPSVAARLEQTRANAAALAAMLDGIPGLRLVPVADGAQAAFWALLVFVDERDNVLRSIKEQGVHVSGIHQRNDAYSAFRQGAGTSALPHTTLVQQQLLGLPCGWWLSAADLTTIASAVRHAVSASTTR